MATKQHTIVIAGAGTFGTALAERFSWNLYNTVLLYNRDQKVVDDINENHRNSKSFPLPSGRPPTPESSPTAT